MDRNVLVVDIERSPGQTPIFDQRTRGFIPVTQWLELPQLLCLAAKWRGARTTEFLSVWDDREQMVLRSWELYDQAEVVVTYNGVSFDNRHLRTEWLKAGLPKPRPWHDVDLYKVNKAEFGFESKSLNHLCRQLGLDVKAGHYDPVAALLCLEGDERVQRRMRRYNRGDVKITEQALEVLLPYLPSTVHRFVCDGELEENGIYRAPVRDYRLYRCRGCSANVKGAWIR